MPVKHQSAVRLSDNVTTHTQEPMKGLTRRQQEVLDYVRHHFAEKGYWPSIRDTQKHFNFKSTNAVIGHLRALESKAYLKRIPGQARAYQLAKSFRPRSIAEEPDSVIELPVYGNIAAGYPDGIESAGEIGRLQINPAAFGIRNSRKSFALRVQGDSMVDAGIQDGDTVIVESGESKNGDIVAALIDGEMTLKRFVQEPGQTPYLKAENDNYPQLHPVAELLIQGVARGIMRSY